MKKILIVDDEKDLTWSLSRGLSKKFPEWQILAANSYHEASNLLKKNLIDLLITDFRMPDGDGIALIQMSKRKNPKIFSILITAYGSADLMQTLMQHPEIVYLEKPFEIEKLREIITKWIMRPPIPQSILRDTRSAQRTKIVSRVIYS